jgi:hypothetical protein
VCAQNTINNVRGCCGRELDLCTIPTTCINGADLSTSCNEACTLDLYTRKWYVPQPCLDPPEQ